MDQIYTIKLSQASGNFDVSIRGPPRHSFPRAIELTYFSHKPLQAKGRDKMKFFNRLQKSVF
jgi:hypothetical protein